MRKHKPYGQTKAIPTSQLPQLQDRLVLNRYLCGLFGCEDFRGLRDVLRDQKEGWAEDGHSYFFRVLEGPAFAPPPGG